MFPLKYIHGHKCTLKRTTQDFSHAHTKHTTFPFQLPCGDWKFSRCKMEELLCIQDARSNRSKDKYVPHFSAAFRSKSLQPLMCLKCRGKDAVRTNLRNTNLEVNTRSGSLAFEAAPSCFGFRNGRKVDPGKIFIIPSIFNRPSDSSTVIFWRQ